MIEGVLVNRVAPRSKARLVRVALVDDHEIVRSGLRQYLHAAGDINVIGEAATGSDALNLLRRVRPDVLVLDLQMRDRSGIDTMASIRARQPDLGILILSGFTAEKYAVKLLRLGAHGYLNKQCDPAEIATAIRVIASGNRYIQPEVSGLLLSQIVDEAAAPAHEQLTARQFQIFLKLARGVPQPEIAKELALSTRTVSTYRSQVAARLELKSDAEFAYYALKQGLID